MGKLNTPPRLRTVRHIETGDVTRQSSNKTKRLLKLGGYEEIFPGRRTEVLAKSAEQVVAMKSSSWWGCWTRADIVVASCALFLLAAEGVLVAVLKLGR